MCAGLVCECCAAVVGAFLHADTAAPGGAGLEVSVGLYGESVVIHVDGDGRAGCVFACVGECFLDGAVGALLFWGGEGVAEAGAGDVDVHA